ncbi:MAG: PAS domain S-box protein [Oculatellaceae cyanobacterium Prado106]|nr:PAS domain S-box protein [Oculatellaceae cyanobacterium Prado106]
MSEPLSFSQSASQSANAPSSAPAFQPKKVLIVDDSPEDQECYRRYLQADLEWQYRFVSTSTGIAGLQQWQQVQPDVILLDYRLPDIDGLTFVDRLRQQASQTTPPQTLPPTIMLTGQGNEAIAVKAIKAGLCDYLVKDEVTPELLRVTVKRVIECGQMNARLRQAERERHETAIALQQSEARYRAIVEDQAELVCRFLPDGTLTFVNSAYCRSFGLSSEELLGRNFLTLVPELERSQVQRYIRELQALTPENSTVTHEHRVLNAAQEITWQEWIDRAIFDEAGRIVEIQSVGRDITDRHNHEIVLRTNKETIRHQLAEIESIYHTAPIGLCFLDADLRYIRINQQLADMNGLPISAHVGRTLRQVLPELADQLEPIYRQVIETGEPILDWNLQGTTPAQPGIIRDWLVSYYPLKDRDNTLLENLPNGSADRILGVNVMVQEITERKRMETALQDSEALFRNMADNAPVMIWVTDAIGHCHFLSRSWYEFTGQTPETGLGIGWLNAVHPDDQERSRQIFLEANQNQEAFRLEYRLRHKDGEYRWAIDAATPLWGLGGEYQGYIGSVIDISDRKQIETEREQQLLREQAARQQAETSNRLKDEFLAMLSHELRSPLNPILGWTRLLQTQQFDATKTAEALAIIERNATLQAQLIEDLLDISRIIQGKLTLTAQPVHLPDIILAAQETIRLAAEAKQIQIIFQLDPALTPIMGDPGRLQQAIWNLLSNAVKFTPKQGRVEVRLEGVGEGEKAKGEGEKAKGEREKAKGDFGLTPGRDSSQRTEKSSSDFPKTQPKNSLASPPLPLPPPSPEDDIEAQSKNSLAPSPFPLAPPYAQITVTDTGKGIHPDFQPHVFD